MKDTINARWLASSNRDIASCLVIFGACMNVTFIIKVKILMFVKWSYRSPQSSGLLSLEWLAYFQHIFQSVLDTSFWLPFLDPHLTTYHSKYRCPYYCFVIIRYTYLNGIVSLNLFSWDIVYKCNHATRMDTITTSIHPAEGCSNYNHETMQQNPIHCRSKKFSTTNEKILNWQKDFTCQSSV